MAKVKNVSGIVPKHSSVKDKMPTAAQLEIGEIAVNVNADSPFISVKCNDGTIKKIIADGGSGYVLVTALPVSGAADTIYVLETSTTGSTGTSYTYELYLYQQNQWQKVSAETLQAGDNITIANNKINANQVVSLTQQEYDELVATSAVSKTALYNISDASIFNEADYQKKLVAGDYIRIDAVNNIIDCTLNPNLYIVVETLPQEGVENKIYLLKVTNEDGTVSFNQYGWINDSWVNYGKTSDMKPNTAGSGITITDDENLAISAKLGQDLTFDGNSAITVSADTTIDSASTRVVQSKTIYEELDKKLDKVDAAIDIKTYFKTVNMTSVGSFTADITVPNGYVPAGIGSTIIRTDGAVGYGYCDKVVKVSDTVYRFTGWANPNGTGSGGSSITVYATFIKGPYANLVEFVTAGDGINVSDTGVVSVAPLQKVTCTKTSLIGNEFYFGGEYYPGLKTVHIHGGFAPTTAIGNGSGICRLTIGSQRVVFDDNVIGYVMCNNNATYMKFCQSAINTNQITARDLTIETGRFYWLDLTCPAHLV